MDTMKKRRLTIQSPRQQLAQSMKDLESIMARGQSYAGNGRFTVRTVEVTRPAAYSASQVCALRNRLGVSQAVFAELLGVSQVLVRSWERGARKPAPMACRLLELIQQDPRWVQGLLHPSTSPLRRKSAA
jgi:DNA-binding transcriptional regulator YiaG